MVQRYVTLVYVVPWTRTGEQHVQVLKRSCQGLERWPATVAPRNPSRMAVRTRRLVALNCHWTARGERRHAPEPLAGFRMPFGSHGGEAGQRLGEGAWQGGIYSQGGGQDRPETCRLAYLCCFSGSTGARLYTELLFRDFLRPWRAVSFILCLSARASGRFSSLAWGTKLFKIGGGSSF